MLYPVPRFHRWMLPLVPAWGFPSERTRALSCREAGEACLEPGNHRKMWTSQTKMKISERVWACARARAHNLAKCCLHGGYTVTGASKPNITGSDQGCGKNVQACWCFCLQSPKQVMFVSWESQPSPGVRKNQTVPTRLHPHSTHGCVRWKTTPKIPRNWSCHPGPEGRSTSPEILRYLGGQVGNLLHFI